MTETPPQPPQPNTTFSSLITDGFLTKLGRATGVKFFDEQMLCVTLVASECDKINAEDGEGAINKQEFCYILATLKHECGFRSIKEYKAPEGTKIWDMQKRYWFTGYYGRGYSQLTWQKNYAKFSPIVGIDLVKSPDEVLKPKIGAKILVIGMYKGLFSGKKLRDYFNDAAVPKWNGARRIVNGTFQAQRVTDVALRILPLLG